MVLECRLSNLCSTETIFKKSTTHYENNLRQSGYNKKLTYKPTDTNHQKHSKHKSISISHSCMQNIKSVINNHNMKVLNNTAEIEEQEQLPSRWKMLKPKHHLQSTDHVKPAQL